jgi:glycine/D-amino acid oxidase-like deaminating enzyme
VTGRRYRPFIDVVIVGAGTFGASLACWLARTGERVTLVDQFEPGDSRASSGGETRLYRCAHGPDADYTAMARRARALWRELEEESGEELLVECGLAWFAHHEDGWEADSERTLAAHGIPAERLDVASATSLYPSFRGRELAFVLLEPEGGVLRAQRSVRALARQAAVHGARMVRGRARPDGAAAVLDDSTPLEGDVIVWACGPWLGRVFPDLVTLSVRRQELLFLDGGAAWRAPGLPSWCDYDLARYGTADIDRLGVKAAIDDLGPPLDPDAELSDKSDHGTAGARLPSRSLPRARTCAPARGTLVPLRAHARHALHRRLPPRASERLAGRRRVGPRLQAWPVDGRAPRTGIP